jgi:hypothetical protein
MGVKGGRIYKQVTPGGVWCPTLEKGELIKHPLLVLSWIPLPQGGSVPKPNVAPVPRGYVGLD